MTNISKAWQSTLSKTVGPRTRGRGTVALHDGLWVEFIQDYFDPPDFSYELQSTGITGFAAIYYWPGCRAVQAVLRHSRVHPGEHSITPELCCPKICGDR